VFRTHPGTHRAKDEAVAIGQVGTTLTNRGQAIMDAGLTGQVSPSEAASLLQALAIQARVIEAEELAARIEALEEKLGVSK
jgi:anthranilate phosphoribosyltransferase